MNTYECPECGAGGRHREMQPDPFDRRIYVCPRCLRRFVVSFSRADYSGHVNTEAPFYGLVLEIDAIFGERVRTNIRSLPRNPQARTAKVSRCCS